MAKKAPSKGNEDFDAATLITRLAAVESMTLPKSAWWADDDPTLTKKLIAQVRSALGFLETLEQRLDPVQMPDEVFTLTDPVTLGGVVVHRLRHRDKVPLAEITKFYGSGVYALFYEGKLPIYDAISGTECPIYVGSAGPDAPTAEGPKSQGMRLFGRINEHHKKSLSKSHNLKPDEFKCRFLVVQSGLEKAAEDFLISLYSPVWNKESKICSGFGKHGDKARTELSPWDVLHGEREWAKTQKSLRNKTPESISADIEKHFRGLLERNPDKWTRIFAESWVKKQDVPTALAE